MERVRTDLIEKRKGFVEEKLEERYRLSPIEDFVLIHPEETLAVISHSGGGYYLIEKKFVECYEESLRFCPRNISKAVELGRTDYPEIDLTGEVWEFNSDRDIWEFRIDHAYRVE